MKQKWLYTLLGFFALFSCVNEDEQAITPPKGAAVRFTAEIPGINTPATRSMDGTKENEMQTIDVLVFDSSNQFVEHKQGQNITQSGTNNEIVNFEAGLSSGTGRSVVVVANARSVISGLTLSAGDSKVSVLQQLQYSHTAKWAADGAGTYTAIPMVGEVTGLTIASGGTVSGISLTRMLARIDVKSTTTDFILERIHLCNYNTNGRIAPTWDMNGTIQSGVSTAPNLPGNPGKNTTTPLAYTPSSQTYEGEIYTFESASASDESGIDHTDRKNATCLVVEGKYNGTTYFYRIDFTKEDPSITDPTRVPYMPLLRNHKYVIDIKSAAGIGYTTLTEALASYTLPSNLKTRLIYYDMSEVKDIVYNGQYFLGVSNKDIKLPRNAQTVSGSDNTLIITTDNPSGWKIENIRITAGAANWLTTDITSGTAGATGTPVKLLMGSNSGAIRTAEIDLSAGRLSYTVKVTQTLATKLRLEVLDGTGTTPVTELVFAGQAPMPQKFQMQWEPTDLSVVSMPNTVGDAAFEFTANNIPNSITDPSGTKSFTIQPTAITSSDLSVNPFFERASSYDFTITEGANSMTKTLVLRQYVPNLAFEKVGFYRTDGRSYSFIVKSNTPWEIKNVQENRTSGSGNLLNLQPGDNLKIATTGGPDKTGEQITFTTTNKSDLRGTVTVTFSSPTGLFADKQLTLDLGGEYYPTPHRGWAGSNIYWDGTKLTFDDVNDHSHENYQGVFFQWGGLTGIDPSGKHNSSWSSTTGLVYKPDGGVGVGGLWKSLLRVGDENITSNPPPGKSERDRNYLYENHDPVNGIGDICKYITDQAGGTLHGKKWRMPTSNEFEAAGDYLKSGFWSSKTSNSNTGTFEHPNEPGYIKTSTGGSTFFPAAGYRTDLGVLYEVGNYGGYWSGSPGGKTSKTFSYRLYFSSDKVQPNYSNKRDTAFSVRCVAE